MCYANKIYFYLYVVVLFAVKDGKRICEKRSVAEKKEGTWFLRFCVLLNRKMCS